MISVLATLALLTLSVAPQSPGDAQAQDPFAGFETIFLENGLKVWYKHIPGDPVVAISVALPFGADMDPPGKEQLAHFTEHMLFSDQPGLTEEEIRRQIEELGGVYNASVTADRSFYYVHIGRQHAEFAIEWLGRILQPHAMDPEVVERQREPVALEVGARPRQFFDWLWAFFLYPPALRTPGFWEREFGMETRATRDYYPFASLNSISPEDLRWFYDEYYVPALMTLTIIGDVDREAVLMKVRDVFGELDERPQPEAYQALSDPGRYWQRMLWAYRSNVYYANRFKFFNLSASDEVQLIFVAQLLGKRLNDKLRFGERKATYGISVGLAKRGGASYLHVTGGIKEDEFEFARNVVDDDLEALRAGTLSPEEFAADKAAVVNQLRVTNSSPEDLERWVRNYFYDPRSYRDFPDLVGVFERLSLEDVEEFAKAGFVPERQALTIVHPHPVTQGLLFVIIVALVWLSVSGVRNRLVRPIDMTRLRYMARFKISPLYLVASTALFLAVIAIAGRLIFYGFQVATEGFLVTLGSFLLQWSAYALMMVGSVVLVVMVLARFPRKLLVLDGELRVKYLSYRSVVIPSEDIEEITLRRFSEVWLTGRLWRCLPLAIGVLAPAIYLKRRRGRSLFFRTRDTKELFELLSGAYSEANGQPSTPRHQA